jgi:imidazolonepropionase-like amidohydrolase
LSERALLISDTDLWTGRDATIQRGICLLAVDGRICGIGARESLRFPANVKVIDGRGTTAIPGLCDLHVHLTNSDHARVVDNATYRAFSTAPEKLLHGMRNGRRALAAGFTTLRVMGHRDVGEVELRSFIEQNLIVGARLFVAPWVISMTGGRGDLFLR